MARRPSCSPSAAKAKYHSFDLDALQKIIRDVKAVFRPRNPNGPTPQSAANRLPIPSEFLPLPTRHRASISLQIEMRVEWTKVQRIAIDKARKAISKRQRRPVPYLCYMHSRICRVCDESERRKREERNNSLNRVPAKTAPPVIKSSSPPTPIVGNVLVKDNRFARKPPLYPFKSSIRLVRAMPRGSDSRAVFGVRSAANPIAPIPAKEIVNVPKRNVSNIVAQIEERERKAKALSSRPHTKSAQPKQVNHMPLPKKALFGPQHMKRASALGRNPATPPPPPTINDLCELSFYVDNMPLWTDVPLPPEEDDDL